MADMLIQCDRYPRPPQSKHSTAIGSSSSAGTGSASPTISTRLRFRPDPIAPTQQRNYRFPPAQGGYAQLGEELSPHLSPCIWTAMVYAIR